MREYLRDRDIACPGHDHDNKCHEKGEHARVWWTGQARSFQFEKERGYCKLRARFVEQSWKTIQTAQLTRRIWNRNAKENTYETVERLIPEPT